MQKWKKYSLQEIVLQHTSWSHAHFAAAAISRHSMLPCNFPHCLIYWQEISVEQGWGENLKDIELGSL